MKPPADDELVRFVVREARLIDEKRFDEWYELFAEDGYYWVPASPGQPDALNHNSLAYEDKLLLQLRIERLKSPLAYSLKPASRCHPSGTVTSSSGVTSMITSPSTTIVVPGRAGPPVPSMSVALRYAVTVPGSRTSKIVRALAFR